MDDSVPPVLILTLFPFNAIFVNFDLTRCNSESMSYPRRRVTVRHPYKRDTVQNTETKMPIDDKNSFNPSVMSDDILVTPRSAIARHDVTATAVKKNMVIGAFYLYHIIWLLEHFTYVI